MGFLNNFFKSGLKKLVDGSSYKEKGENLKRNTGSHFGWTDENRNDRIEEILNLREIDKRNIIELPNDYKPAFHKLTEKERSNHNTAYYMNGTLYDVSPRNPRISLDEDRTVAYDARFIILNGKKYDLYNPQNIVDIEIPEFARTNGSFPYVTRDLSNIIRMRAISSFTPEIAVPLIFKAVNLMISSKISWGKSEYIRLITQLEGLGEYKFSKYLTEELNKRLPFMTDDDYLSKLQLKRQIKMARETGRDLLEIPYLGAACEECAKYQGRVYSITGQDPRFPILPDFVFSYGGIHPGCCHSFSIYYDGRESTIMRYVYNNDGTVDVKNVDAIEFSNRPFIDDRSQKEKENYERCMKKKLMKSQSSNKETLIRYIKRAVEYEWIVGHLSDVAPKSLGGYTKMKHSLTKNYIKIRDMAHEHGFILDDNI